MKKITVYLFSLVLILYPIQITIASSQVCNSSPQILIQYFSNVLSLLEKTNSSAPNKTLKEKWQALWKKEVKEWLWNFRLLSLLSINWLKFDFMSSIYILTHERYIVRDWTKLVNFKNYISKTYEDLAKKHVIDVNIPKWLLGWIKSTIESNVFFIHKPNNLKTYWDVIKYVWDNHQDVENMFFKLVMYKEKIKLKELIQKPYPVDKNHYNELYNILLNAYLDSDKKEFQCDKNVDKSLKRIKDVFKISKKSKKAIERFKCNYKRLKAKIFWYPAPNCSKKSLTKSWHLELKSKASAEWVWKLFLDSITETGTKLINTMNFHPEKDFLEQPFRKIKNYLIKKIYLKTKDKWNKFQHKTVETPNIWWESFVNEIDFLSKKIIAQKLESSRLLIKVDPTFTHDIAPKFTEISFRIWKAICMIDSKHPWCDDSVNRWIKFTIPKRWIYQNLVETCENQSPFIWDCRYKHK